MNELSKFLVESMMGDENPIKKTVVIYVGRFQPMHRGHYAVYEHLVKKFGKDSVFVGTSNKTDNLKSPFNFKEKEKIASTMYNIPKSKFVQVKNPYNPSEVLSKYNKDTTAFVTVVSEKDKTRLKPDTGKYFKTYKDGPTEGYGKRGYVYVVPILGKGVSGTEARNGLSIGSEGDKKKFFKNRVFGNFNKSIYDLVTSKLSEGIEIPQERIEDWLINEASNIGGAGEVDDGPSFFVPNYDVFKRLSVKRAAKIGYEVVDMITNKDIEDYYEHPNYPNGPVDSVSFFPAGVLGTQTPNNQVDIYSSGAYSDWFKHVTRKAAMVGYELVNSIAAKDDIKQDKEVATQGAVGDKKSQEEFENSLNEAITLPVKVGDTILTGRFKNKKVVVKSIGKDEHGMPTINGKKVVTFRLMKEGFVTELAGTSVQCEKCNHSWEIESDDDEKYLCHSCGWDSQQQEYDYDAFDSWREKMGLNEELDERGKLRPSEKLRRKAAMVGKGREIARKRARTMKRRKSFDKLKKIAYKLAYRQVYNEFAKELFPDTPKSQLSIQQSKVVHKNVVRKKKRVLKRAKFRFLPALRAKEAEKFTKKEGEIKEVGIGTGQSGVRMGYPSKDDLKKVEKRVKKQRSNTDSNQEYQYQPITEGGAATGGSPIPAKYSMEMYADVSKVIASTFKITKKDIKPIGSTGKKKEGDFNGDIDMIIDAAKIGGKFKLKFDEVQDFIFNKLKGKFKNVVNLKGLGVVSFLYPIPNSNKFGQVDLMLTDDLELSSFMYHSPNFKENESKYKGLYRNTLLFSIVKHIPTNIPDEYFDDGKDGGKVKKFSKHSLHQKKGLMTQIKSFQGKAGALKNPKTIKGGDIHITSVPSEIVKYVFGDKYTVDDMKSFESIYKIVMKSNFKHKKFRPKIIKTFKDGILNKNLPLPSEIK